MAVKPDLVSAVDHLVEEWAGVSRRRMFGGLCYTVHGRMFLALLDDLVLFKVPDSDREACLEEHGVRPANLHGTVFGKWLAWTWDEAHGLGPVAQWVRASYELAAESGERAPAGRRRLTPRRRPSW